MKKAGRHQTLCAEVRRRIARIAEHNFVRKVIIGTSTGKSHGYPVGHLKFMAETKSGIRVNAYGSRGITTIHLYCDSAHVEQVKALLETA